MKNKMTKKNKPRALVLSGISDESRMIAKKAAKEEGLTLAGWFEGIINDHNVKRFDSLYGQEMEYLKMLMEKSRFNHSISNNSPVALTFGALSEDVLDQKILLHIYNKLRSKSGKESVDEFPRSPWYIRLSDRLFGK